MFQFDAASKLQIQSIRSLKLHGNKNCSAYKILNVQGTILVGVYKQKKHNQIKGSEKTWQLYEHSNTWTINKPEITSRQTTNSPLPHLIETLGTL